MFKLFKRIGLLLDIVELLIVRVLKSENEQQEQKSAALTKVVEDAKAYRRHVIEEIVKSKVAMGTIPDEAIAENTRQLEECPYDELKRLQWDYRLRTVMMDKHGNA
jgi:hypothetical protein